MEMVTYPNFEHDSNNADAAGSSIWSNLILCTNNEQKVISIDTSKVINTVVFIAIHYLER
jgi:hypothetical protein